MMIPVSCKKLLVVLLWVVVLVSGQDNTTSANNDTDTTTSSPPQDDKDSSPSTPSSSSCNCEGCPEEESVALGLHNDLVSPECPEGSVATVTQLRTIDTSGEYDLVTWNPGDYSQDINISPNYVYRKASNWATSCYEIPTQNLPVVGDQTQIEVQMNCESVYCNFQYDVQFGCASLGVLTTDRGAGGGLQILSDVDDTITCANPSTTCDSIPSCTVEGTISHYLAGIDRRLEHKEMYPGVAELMAGLALGPGTASDDGNQQQQQYYPAKPMMLSARPREGELFLAIDQDSEINVYFEGVGQRINQTWYWGINVDSSMYGTITDGTSFTEFGQTKARSYNTVSSERPNTRFAFLGDNGQGDVCAAQSMLESENGSRMMAVLIHQVLPLEETHSECQSPEGQDFTLNLPESDKVHYHRTHSDVAMWLLDKGLISCCSASNVWYAVSEWIMCRCNKEGEGRVCPIGGLDTGVSDTATRNETLSYCEEVKADQELLLAKIESCDPSRACSPLGDILPTTGTSLSSSSVRKGNGLFLGASLMGLIHHVIVGGKSF